MKLPGPCPQCAPFGGSWTETETGLKRCSCPRGLALIEAAKVPQPERPGHFPRIRDGVRRDHGEHGVFSQ